KICMRRFCWIQRPVTTIAMGLALAGCSEQRDDLPREPVSGKVSFEGEPLGRGAIVFRPANPGAGGSVESGGLIREGEYRIPKADGPVPGTYKVVITEEIERPKEAGEAPGPRMKLQPSRVSSRYNTKTVLTAEVKAGQSNSFDFDLKKSTDPEPV